MGKKEDPNAPVIYVCVDCEASGPVPGLYNMVSLAAVPVISQGAAGHRVQDDQLYLEFKPVFPGFEREAMKIHGLTKKHLIEKGIEPKKGMKILRDWSLSLKRSKRDELVFVGHNAPFDWSYIAYYFVWAKLANPFGYKALDSKALAMGKLDIPWLATSKGTIASRVPSIGREDMTQKHRADYDARYQAQLLAGLLDYRR